MFRKFSQRRVIDMIDISSTGKLYTFWNLRGKRYLIMFASSLKNKLQPLERRVWTAQGKNNWRITRTAIALNFSFSKH